MGTTIEFRTEHRQSATLSPRLQHAVRLLQLSSLDFAAMVRDTLGRNPFLEAEEGAEDASPESAGVDERDHDRERDLDPRDTGLDAPPTTADLTADLSREDDDRALWQAEPGSSGLHRADDGDMTAMDMMAVETTLAQHLHTQLNVLPLDDRELFLARTVVESLDDDGYLRTPLDELVAVAPVDPPATLEELQIALCRVQALEPEGVGARSVAECLTLQLPAIDCPRQRALAHRIVAEHLPRLAARDVPALARECGESLALTEAVCDRIRRLNPRPGWRFGTSQVAYVVPDVLVRKIRGEWAVRLNPAVVPKVRLNQVYAELFQRHRNPQNAELAGHLQEARWTVRNVEQRFSTIVDVAEAIVRRQRHFLEFGAMAMKPLALRDIAEEVGIHESTVSRVTNNKYMATPSGVYELKFFFSRAMVSSNGSACSGTAIRGLIKDMIESERPEAPLSDAEVTRQLTQQGLVVARRTVTKYRQMLKIEPVDRRRRHV